MEWMLPTMFWSLVADLRHRTPPVPAVAREPTEIDVRLVELAYDVIAAETRCTRCGARLGRGVHLMVSPGALTPAWRIVVVTGCRGRRRHRHTAVVTKDSGDLNLGPLRI